MAEIQFLKLTTKPTAQLAYRFFASTSTAKKPVLLTFLNGLGLPQVAWTPAITKLQELRKDAELPPILTYDRFGQGETETDPNDEGAPDPMHGHDAIAVVKDLRQLLSQVVSERLGVSDLDSVALVFAANSIGCAIARLYAQEYPGTVAGLLLLDSVLANSDFVSIFPDPDAEGFDPSTLPEGVTPDGLRQNRAGVGKVFHPSVGSKEGLSRKNLAQLLPASDAPILKGPGGHGPFLSVVGHDFGVFAEQSQNFGWAKQYSMEYTNPYWHAYNEGLAQLTQPERSKGPFQAPLSGHFIQKDNPEFVAKELDELLSKVL